MRSQLSEGSAGALASLRTLPRGDNPTGIPLDEQELESPRPSTPGLRRSAWIARIGASLMSKDLGALSQAIPVRVGDQLRGAREWPSRSPAGRAFRPLSRVSARKQRIENQLRSRPIDFDLLAPGFHPSSPPTWHSGK